MTHALQFMAAVVVGTGIYRGESVLPGPPPAIVGIFIAATTLLWHLEGVQVGACLAHWHQHQHQHQHQHWRLAHHRTGPQ